MKLWYWHNMLKLSDSAGEKLKLAARGFAAAASFNFLSAEFNETVQSFNNFQRMRQKSVIFIVSFNWNWAQKKKINAVSL